MENLEELEEAEQKGNVYFPQPGPQAAAVDARYLIDELFYGGARGGGKTYYLVLDFAIDSKEYGRNFHGVLFRKTYAQLDEVVKLTKEIYGDIFPDAEFKVGTYTWEFANGSTLKLRYLDKDEDAENYRGHSYQWVAFDELDQWPTPAPYNKIKATLRSGKPGIPKRIRSTGNPGGVGHHWIKKRFIDPCPQGFEKIIDEESGESRMFIPSKVDDNAILLQNDPLYKQRIKAATEGDEQLQKAWLDGSWDVFFGSFFDMFDPAVHMVDPFEVAPGGIIPPHWRLEGALDYGERSPTAFGLFATDEEGFSYLIDEYCVEGLWVDQHAENIKKMIAGCAWTRGRMPERIWADNHIFHVRTSATQGIPSERYVSGILSKGIGITLKPTIKDRITGWRFLKNMLAWKRDNDTGDLLKTPRLRYFPGCREFERTMRLARYATGEGGNSEDLDQRPNQDHIPDMVRYWCMGSRSGRQSIESSRIEGVTFDDLMESARRKRLGINTRVTYVARKPDPIGEPDKEFYYRCLSCYNTFETPHIKCRNCGHEIIEKVKIRDRSIPAGT